MANRRVQIEARLNSPIPGHRPSDGDVRWLLDALAEAEAERERWKEAADAADDVIRAVLAALYRGPDTDAVIRAKKVMAERDALAAKLAAVEEAGATANHGSAEDGFGGYWSRCGEHCDLQVVRPGKVQCGARDTACPDGGEDA